MSLDEKGITTRVGGKLFPEEDIKQFIEDIRKAIVFRGKFRPQQEQYTLTAVIGDIEKFAGKGLI